jgi:hypothetical protein
MGSRVSREELENALREAWRGLPWAIAQTAVIVGAVWAGHRWMRLSWSVVTPAAIPLAIQITRIISCGRALRQVR